MRIILSMLTTLAWCWLVPAAAFAAQAGPADAIALAEQGARFIRQYGKDEMARRIKGKDPLFCRAALHLAMRDLRGNTLADPGAEPDGRDRLDVADTDGKLFRQEMMAIANGAGRGWVDYQWRDAATGRIEERSTYVLRAGDVALEAGIRKTQAALQP